MHPWSAGYKYINQIQTNTACWNFPIILFEVLSTFIFSCTWLMAAQHRMKVHIKASNSHEISSLTSVKTYTFVGCRKMVNPPLKVNLYTLCLIVGIICATTSCVHSSQRHKFCGSKLVKELAKVCLAFPTLPSPNKRTNGKYFAMFLQTFHHPYFFLTSY